MPQPAMISAASQALCRLIDVSRILIPPARLGMELDSILEAARRINAAAGVTGAPIHSDNCFAQALEGGEDAVQSASERIERDPRHAAARVVDISAVEQRSFPAWAVAGAVRLNETVTLMEYLKPGFQRALGAETVAKSLARFEEHSDVEITRGSALKSIA